jgi:hypothetical protein
MRQLPDLREAVPDEQIAVRGEAFVLRGLRLEEQLVRRGPLLRREVERGQSVRDRDDDAAAGKHVGRVARIARRGVQAVRVLNAHVGGAKQGQVAEDAVLFGHRYSS